MTRHFASMILLCAAWVLVGCETPKQYMTRHGEPDLISDETAVHRRMYLPGDTVQAWRNATTILYYLETRTQVIFKQGQVRKSAIPEDEIETLQATRTLLEAIDADAQHIDW